MSSLHRSTRCINHTLQPTALINEAYLRLAGQSYESWQDRQQFVLVAATVMRRVLVDYARKRLAAKRPQRHLQVDIDEHPTGQDFSTELIIIDEVLEQLADIEPRQARIVELRYFAGLSMEETAEMLDISRSSVAREWGMAQAQAGRRASRPRISSAAGDSQALADSLPKPAPLITAGL